uniref:Ras-GAP domain-containing protein n=1 Tax=Monodelphis domestica TaxID=13616 RepID=A0A5F8H4C0_MONDO
QTLVTLKNPNAVLISVIDSLAENYQKELWETKQRKEERAKEKNILLTEAERDPYEELLTHAEIQGSINKINRLIAVDEINAVIRKGDPRNTVMALMKPEAQLPNVHPFAAVLYQDELFNLQKQSSLNYLTPEELSMTVEMLSDIALLNQAMENKDIESIQNHLQNPAIGFCNVNEKYLGCYICKLLSLKTEASSQGEDNLSKNEIQNHIHMVNLEIQEEEERNAAIANINKAIDGKNHNNTLMALQAPAAKVKNVNPDNAYHYQDVLFYAKAKKVKVGSEHQAAYVSNTTLLEKAGKLFLNRCYVLYFRLLSWELSVDLRKLYTAITFNRINIIFLHLVTHEGSWLKLRLRDTYNFYYNIETEMGTWIYPEDFANKVSWLTEPEIKVWYYEKGLQEELELENLRQEVISKIKANQALEKDLNLMDIKIGLLVKNRITLQDVILQNKKLNKTKAEKIITMSGKQGIKSLSLEKRKKLEAYQHLFYILQTNPSYLAKLIFQVPQIKGTNFMNNAIFTLYNYASNEREEYLFLKFLKTALEEEISQVNQIQDIVNENATVSKMVINFSRGAIAQNALCQLIFPVVKEIIDDTSLAINTNPVDVYKTWINQSEVETGAISKLPYNIKKEQALSRAEIRAKLNESIETLQRVTDKILDIMFSSLDQIPYGMRYVAKMLKTALEEKFPNAPEDEILKIIGNFLYCQYMNPAIVTPDRFGLLDMIPGNQIFPVERKNLESVAQLLEHAASDKMFEGENDHLSSLNYYVSETFKKFRNFFKEVCNVPEPEDKFNIDEFTDIVTINKPTIYMTIEEIINIHSLLLEHKATIAPEKNDPLKELLADLREVPDIEAFLGEGSVDPNDPNKENTLNELLKTEISLSLSNKYDLKGENIDLMRKEEEKSKMFLYPSQELEYNLRMEKKILLASKIPEEMKSNQIMLDDAKLPLEEKKRKIQRNLQILEESGLVSEANKYQELLSEIAKDIRNQHACRERRRCELKKLRQTLEALNSKSIFFQDQINHYDAYIKTCLDNLPIKAYCSLITKFKNIMFHFIPGKEVGNFEIKTRSRDYEIEIVKLNIQDLLQMQYEGVTVMKIFGRVKMNVNLLIFLLNKKFYGK